MKRLMFILFVLIQSLDLYSQKIQDQFYGVKFGDSMSVAYDKFKSKFNINVSDESIDGYDVDFGGFEWRFFESHFLKDKFGNIYFSQNYTNKQTAMDRYYVLKRKLDNKYNKYKSAESDENNDIYSYYLDDTNLCSLTVTYNESKGGEMFWYVGLMYTSFYYLDNSSEEHDNEL